MEVVGDLALDPTWERFTHRFFKIRLKHYLAKISGEFSNSMQFCHVVVYFLGVTKVKSEKPKTIVTNVGTNFSFLV